MTNTAVLVGNSQYNSLGTLECCHDDLLAMKELLKATDKYSGIEVIENDNADELKSKMRDAIDKTPSTEELFFYFTGHGCLQEDEFYFCATNFDSKRPNQTGLSNSDLHILLKLADADVVVKVIDACNSGTLLIKADNEFIFHEKHGFKNLIQISSCQQSQNSLIGEPLSIFTEKFRASTLRKKEGIIYYTDIISTLRDEFIQNNEQTPFFVSQVTGREQFIDDAKRLNTLRAKLTTQAESSLQSEDENQQTPSTAPNLQTLLEETERNIATREKITSFVNTFFDDLIEKVSNDEFSDFFDLNIVEHSDFEEETAKIFITTILSKESRSDNFVTATIQKEYTGRRDPRNSLESLFGIFGDNRTYRNIYTLLLNCEMERAQLKITLTPKFHSLKQLILVVTCVPSLENCYVFEIGSQHSLKDFGKFSVEGDEIVRRWNKFNWSENTNNVVEKITSKLNDLVQEHLKSTKQRLIEE